MYLIASLSIATNAYSTGARALFCALTWRKPHSPSLARSFRRLAGRRCHRDMSLHLRVLRGQTGTYLVRGHGARRVSLQGVIGGANLVVQPGLHGAITRDQRRSRHDFTQILAGLGSNFPVFLGCQRNITRTWDRSSPGFVLCLPKNHRCWSLTNIW
jgi:hypothetical protein